MVFIQGEDHPVRIVTMLLHDERFSGWSLDEKLNRFHFSKRYLEFCRSFGWEPYLYCFHESVSEEKVYDVDGLGVIKVFPVSFRLPPFIGFGNDHNPKAILNELKKDEPDLIHFHNYYLFSFSYLAPSIKKRFNCPLTTQLHGYHQNWRRRVPYLSCLHQLKLIDTIFYSYRPEETVYRKFGVLEKAVKVPMPSIDPTLFKPDLRRKEENLLYVGRLPERINAYADKSPALILFILKKLLRFNDVKLVMVGDGIGLSCYRKLVSKLGIEDNVEFIGHIPHSEIPRFYQEAGLTFVPLKLYDIDGFFDGSVQESLACETAVAGLKSSFDTPFEGTFGFLLSPNLDRAAEELSKIFDDLDAHNDIAKKGSAFVHTYCTEERLKKILRYEWEGILKR